jgi:hypothetical protein
VLKETDRLERRSRTRSTPRRTAEPGPADLQAVVRDANDRWHGRLRRSVGRCVRTVRGRTSEGHRADRRARQILDVLLDNALQHGRGVVQLSLQTGRGRRRGHLGRGRRTGVSGDAVPVFSTNGQGGHGFGLPLAYALADGRRAPPPRHGGPGPVFELAVR